MKLVDYIDINVEKNIIKCKIIPNSPKNEFINQMGDGTLKVRISAIPEKGKANKELIKFISRELGINKNSIEIKYGETSVNKTIKINYK